mgnify:CR=1 FL=1
MVHDTGILVSQVRAGGGIGSCGGGAIRSALGAFDPPSFALGGAAVLAKAILLLMPVLAAMQWGLRSAQLSRRYHREKGRQAGRVAPATCMAQLQTT